MTGPYAQAAGDYWHAGWRGVLPLPPRRKTQPPTGYTGWDGAYPSFPDITAWTEDRGEGNVALHLPDGVLGIDVDNYAGKVGGATLELRERAWGPLPATWRTTSRDDGISGIRLYRVPVSGEGRSLRWPGKVGPGIETVHRGHRYAVVPPSIHPDTERAYRWINPDGAVSLTPPRVEELPELPWPWVAGLTDGREANTYTGADMSDEEIKTWLAAHNRGHEPCGPMADARDRLAADMSDGAHESLAGLMHIVGLAARGHLGLSAVLGDLRAAFLTEVTTRRTDRDEAADEWRRSLFGAVDKVAGRVDEQASEEPSDAPLEDPCEVPYSMFADPWDATAGAGVETGADRSPVEWPGVDDRTFPESSGEESSDEPRPRELTDAERAELAAARRERAIAKAEHDLGVMAEARHRHAIKNAPPLTILGIDEFLARPRPVPLVEGLLYRNSLARIFGAPGCGKSFVAVDLALRLCLGWDWNEAGVEQSKVVYVMAEGDAVNNERIQAWMDRHRVKADQLRGWFRAVPHKVLLLEEALRPFIDAVVADGVDLVILDTKNRMMVGNENTSEDNAVMLRALDTVREATGCCVLLIDHTGLSAPDRAKGNTAGEGGMDTEALVENDKQSPPKVAVTVTRDKAREAGRRWEFFLRSHPLHDGTDAAVLLALDDEVELPVRASPNEVERRWRDADTYMPAAVSEYEGPGQAAVPDLAKFMAHDAGIADPDGIGVTRSQAESALSVRVLGKTASHSGTAVRRAWSALRAMGYLAPADGKDGSDGKAENTTGRHVWTAR